MDKIQKFPKEIKCVIVGDRGVGKTSLLLSYTTGGISIDYMPTCFGCYSVDLWVQEKNHTLSVIDTASQETYDISRTLLYKNADVFVLCFSIATVDSFENITERWVHEIRRYCPDTPCILVGTQTDRRGIVQEKMDKLHEKAEIILSQRKHKCISTKKGKSVAKRIRAHDYLECSALEGTGVDVVFRAALIAAITPQKGGNIFKTCIRKLKGAGEKRYKTNCK